MDFQSKVNMGVTRGWHGDFASVNPHVSVVGSDGMYPTGTGGVTVGSFVWVDENTHPNMQALVNKGSGTPVGFVAREWNGTINTWQAVTSNSIPQGIMVTAYAKGEFFIELTNDVGSVSRGDDVYADPATGSLISSSTKGAVKTNYKYAMSGNVNDIVTISAWI